MRSYVLASEQQGEVSFTGELLGTATSEGEHHSHPGSQFVQPGRDAQGRKNKCNACRWHEVDIYRTDDGRYILHTVGATTIPGEIELARIISTRSAYELVELTVVRAASPYIPVTSLRALAQAASLDDDVQDAFVNRAVV